MKVGSATQISLPPINVRSSTIVLFIGSPRTGSTLLGQLLNHHPQALIANEARALASVLSGSATWDDAMTRAAHIAWEQFRVGLEADHHFAPTLNQYQPRWQSLRDLADRPECAKRGVRVIGDKKAGGNIEAILANPSEFHQLMTAGEDIRLMHIVRRPIIAARSLMKSHGAPSLEAALESVLRLTNAAWNIGSRYPERYYCLDHNDLCSLPHGELRRLLEWLGIAADPRWIALASEKLSPTADPALLECEVESLSRCADEFGVCPPIARWLKVALSLTEPQRPESASQPEQSPPPGSGS